MRRNHRRKVAQGCFFSRTCVTSRIRAMKQPPMGCGRATNGTWTKDPRPVVRAAIRRLFRAWTKGE